MSTPTILVVDDEPRYRALYAQVLTEAGLEVVEAADAEAAERLLATESVTMVVSDVRMPGASGLDLLEAARARSIDVPFLLVTAYTDVRDAVDALKLGAVDYLAKPVDLAELLAVVQDTLGLAPDRQDDDPPVEVVGDIVAASPATRALLQDAWRVARSDVNVLLTGESGVGKEVIANFLHRASERSGGPFIAVNCAALPGELLSSELFGHERGAFTGASSARKGRFREAERGTLFLDEIGDMPLELQPVLLRALQERVVTPVGGSTAIPVDFRLVAATNRPLEEDVDAGRFRSDLYYRLNVIALHIPPLRERVEDILPLARRILAAADGPAKRIGRAAARLLVAYAWPGNVRELHNAMERARLLSRADVILPEALPPAIRRAADRVARSAGEDAAPSGTDHSMPTLRESEIQSLRRALAMTDGNRTKAAELLGITRRGLLKKLKRFELVDPAE